MTGLIDKKTVSGKELNVTAAKAPHEKGSFVNRVARLKKIEKLPNVWPAPTYKKVATSDPLKNQAFPTAFVHGHKLTVAPTKTIKKRVAVPSTALYLSKIPKGVTKKQILEAFKNAKVRRTLLKNNFGFLLFKDAEERKKAQEVAKDQKITVGDHTISVAESTKFSNKTVEVPKEVKPAKPAAEKKPLSVNGIASKLFTQYRKNLFNRKQRLIRIAAVNKIKEHKLAVASGKVQPRVVRKISPKKDIAKPNPKIEKTLKRRAVRKALVLKKKSGAGNKKAARKLTPAKKASVTATA